MGLKSIFDGLYLDQLIQKNERGEIVIYPHGMMGRGYMLPAEREPGMRQRLRMLIFASLIVGAAYSVLLLRVIEQGNSVGSMGWVMIAISASALLCTIIYYQSRLTIGLQPSSEARPPAREWLRRGRKARPTWTYWISAIVGVLTLLMAMPGIALGMADTDLYVAAGSVFLLFVGALLVWDGTLGLMERARAQ